LTVPPKTFLTVLKSRSSQPTAAKRRCGPIGAFSGDGGAGLSPAQAISPSPSTATRACSSVRSGRARAPSALAATDSVAFVMPAPPPEIEQHGPEVDARDAVDHRVVRLGQQREAPVGEPLDEPQLPQRLRAVELLGEDARQEVVQLLVAAGARQRRVADVVLEVEVGVVGPQRAAAGCGREDEPLPVARNEVQAHPDRVEELLVGRRRPLDAHERADVHVRARALLVQERRVDRCQPVEVARGHRRQTSPAPVPSSTR
jgi:hypothetical protein